jgi:hypothetical protein
MRSTLSRRGAQVSNVIIDCLPPLKGHQGLFGLSLS